MRLRHMKLIAYTVTFLLLPFTLMAYQLTGVVRDSLGKTIPYVSIFVQNTTYGVATNLKGQYYLQLEPGTHNIVFQSVGYKKKTVEITITYKNERLNVTLYEALTELNIVQISADKEDPAYPIMRKAIENRHKYRKPADAFSCSTYIKASLQKEFMTHDTMSTKERDTLPNVLTKENMNFHESYGSSHFKAPNKWKEIKTAVKDISDTYNATVEVSITFDTEDDPYPRESVNKNLFKINLSEATFNFYKNNLYLPSLGPVPFVSPLSKLAMLSYKFRFEESFLQEGKWINKIEVIPRRTDAALFRGYIYIVDDWWNIKAVDLEPDKRELYHFKYFRILQDYDFIKDSTWMLSREEFFYDTREGKMHILGNTMIIYSDYDLNPTFNKRFFHHELRTVTDTAAEVDSSYWKEIRPITLKDDEKEFIRRQDSIDAYHLTAEFMVKDDSIYNHHTIWDYLLNGFGWTNSFKKRTLYFDPLIQQMYIFGVGGYRHAPGGSITKELSKAYRVELDWLLNYGFNNNDLKGSLGIDVLYLPRKFGSIHADYKNAYTMLNEYESFEAIFSRGNYINEIGYSLGHDMEFINGLFIDFTVEYGEKKPITGIELTTWSDTLFGEFNEPQQFQAFEELLIDIKLRYTIGQQYMTEPYKKINLPSKWPTFTLRYKKGIPGFFGSIADYDFMELKFKDDIMVGTIGVSKVRAMAGGYLTSKNVQLTDYKYFRRSDMYIFSNPLKSFQLLRPGYSAISTDGPYFMVNYLHNFNGTLLNKIPLIKKTGLQLAGGAGILLMERNDFQHAEIFFGLEWPFRIRRQVMKMVMYYAVSYSNQSDIRGEFKIGFDFFNSWTNSWSY
ncbi:MAG TPA: carboxypeptidase-like regulatory domain-containing protein [Flavobacteriales bacterium]|nr:carboxypeptidase-like regulatory domain-containing protein [Flavobacteriales bacterium]